MLVRIDSTFLSGFRLSKQTTASTPKKVRGEATSSFIFDFLIKKLASIVLIIRDLKV